MLKKRLSKKDIILIILDITLVTSLLLNQNTIKFKENFPNIKSIKSLSNSRVTKEFRDLSRF